MTTEPYVPGEMELVQSHAFFAPARPQDMDVRPKAAERGIAKIKADALREAATEFEARLPDGTGNGRAYNSYRVAELLNARADRIEGEV